MIERATCDVLRQSNIASEPTYRCNIHVSYQEQADRGDQAEYDEVYFFWACFHFRLWLDFRQRLYRQLGNLSKRALAFP